MDLAAAAEYYAKKVKLGAEAIGYAHSIKIKAEIKLGGYLKASPKNVGAMGSVVTGTARVPVKDTTPTLANLGLTKKQSSEARQLDAN